jgi:hypothetical protein
MRPSNDCVAAREPGPLLHGRTISATYSPRLPRALISRVYFCCGCFLPPAACGFPRARYCLAGNTRLLWTTVLADLFIGVSYVAISATLVRVMK